MPRVRKSEIRSKKRGQKRLVIVVASLVGLLVVLLAGGWLALVSYLTGDGFRQRAENALSDLAGSRQAVSLPQNFQLSGSTVTLPELHANLPDGSFRLSLNKAAVSVDPWPLTDGCLSLPATEIERVDLTTDAGIFTLPFAQLMHQQAGGGFPSSYRLGPLRIRRGNFHFRAGGDLFTIDNTRFELTPTKRNFSDWSATFTGGEWKSPYPLLQDAPLRSATLSSQNGELHLKEARFMSPPGEVRLSARLSTRKQRWSTNARIDKANVQRLLVHDWKKRLSGYLYGKVKLQGDLAGLTHGEGEVVLHEGVLTALPILEKLAYLGEARYRSLPLDQASARFSFPYSEPSKNIHDATLIDHIEIESTGLLRIVGRIIIGNNGKLNGNLLVGLPDEVFGRFPAPVLRAFGTLLNASGEPGYHWVNVNLSGTIDAPQEDLSIRVMNLLSAPGLVEQAGRSALDTLQNALPAGILSRSPSPSLPPTPETQGHGAEAPAPGSGTPPPPSGAGSLLDEAADQAEGALRRGLQSFF